MSSSILSSLGRALRGLWWLLDASRRALLNLLLLALVAAGVWAAFKSGPPAIEPRTALVLDLAGPVVEQRAGSLRDSALKQLQGDEHGATRLRDVIAVLDAAAKDEQVPHALLMLDDFAGAGLPTLREIAAAIERFKAAGKPVYAWGSNFDQRQYYLAAHATEVWLHPMGIVYVEGYGRYRNYYKDLLDRVGVSANVLRVGKFKSFAEPYSANAPSPEVAGGRRRAVRVAVAELDRQRREGPPVAGRQRRAGHRIAARQPAVRRRQSGALGAGAQVGRRAEDPRRGARAAHRTRRARRGEQVLPPGVAGPLSGPASSPTPQRRRGGRDRGPGRDQRRQARRPAASAACRPPNSCARRATTTSIKAIVLRVNSPGGSAFGSELVRRELELTRQAGKPVVVSMGDVAASGGYWISMAADEVIADEATITGSIGVVALLPTAEGAMDKLGVRTGGVTTTWLAGAYDPRRAFDPRFGQLVQTIIDRAYLDFTTLAAGARKTTPARIDEVGQGRVWSGRQAVERGLVDRTGGLGDALAAAAAARQARQRAPGAIPGSRAGAAGAAAAGLRRARWARRSASPWTCRVPGWRWAWPRPWPPGSCRTWAGWPRWPSGGSRSPPSCTACASRPDDRGACAAALPFRQGHRPGHSRPGSSPAGAAASPAPGRSGPSRSSMASRTVSTKTCVWRSISMFSGAPSALSAKVVARRVSGISQTSNQPAPPASRCASATVRLAPLTAM